ncbi:MAG: hypothetical protein WDO24_24405 [Pseudomonadota bacterium]
MTLDQSIPRANAAVAEAREKAREEKLKFQRRAYDELQQSSSTPRAPPSC